MPTSKQTISIAVEDELDVTLNPALKEESIQIALNFLERSGEIDDAYTAELLLSDTVEFLMNRGISSRLVLSNLAISAYQRHMQARTTDKAS